MKSGDTHIIFKAPMVAIGMVTAAALTIWARVNFPGDKPKGIKK